MPFDQTKRCRFVTKVFVEGAQDTETLTGIDPDGHQVQFRKAAIEAGNAVHLYDIDADMGWFGDDEDDNGFDQELDVGLTQCAAYHVCDEDEPSNGYAYDLDLTNQVALIDRDGITERMPLSEFFNKAYRCTEAGHMIAFMGTSLRRQYSLCQEHDLTAHMTELDGLFTLMKSSDNANDQMQAYFHDIEKVQGDGKTFDEIYEQVYRENQTPLHERFELNEKTNGSWVRVLDGAGFKSDKVRAMLRFFLADRIGDFPVEEMSACLFGSFQEAKVALANVSGEGKVTPKFEGGTLMPGYETSEVLEFDAEGLTVIVFSDMSKLGYAYAYPTRRALLPQAELTAEAKV